MLSWSCSSTLPSVRAEEQRPTPCEDSGSEKLSCLATLRRAAPPGAPCLLEPDPGDTWTSAHPPGCGELLPHAPPTSVC
eukprot:4863342-Prymnesium_polylepis.1